MKKSNLAVQLMPMVFVICSVGFYALNASFYAAASFVLSVLFSIVIIGEVLKE